MTVRDSGSLFLEVASRPAATGVGIEFDVYDGGSLGTMLATFEGATQGSAQNVISDTGAGSFSINKHDPKYGYVVRDNFVKVRVDGVYRSAFFIEEINPVEASPNGEGAEMVKVGGRGALAYLERAVVYPSDWATGGSTPKVSYAGVTKAAVLIQQLEEAQARGALLSLSWDFTATNDSRGEPWSDSVTLDFHIGTDFLSLAKSLSALGNFDIDMTPSLKLRAFNSQGADITSTVVFREGKHLGQTDLSRQLHARTNKTRILVEGSGSWLDSHGKTQYALEVTDTTEESNPLIGRRESYVQYSKSNDIGTLEGVGSALIQQLRDQGESLQLPVTHGPSADALGNATGDYQPFVDYVKGDTPALDVPGTFDRVPYRVVGITVSQREGDDYDVTLDFNSLYLEHLLRLKQQVDGLSGGTGAGVSSSQVGGTSALGSGPPGTSSGFGKVAVASDDSADYLDAKLVAATGGGVSVVRIGSGGTQQLEIAGAVVAIGTLAARPAASAANASTFYFATDVAGGTLYVSSGSAWSACAPGTSSGSAYIPASTLTTEGDMLYQHSGAPTRLPVGGAGTVLHGGTDPSYSAVVESDLSLSDVTTGNVSATKHGFAPKVPNDNTKFLDGTGAYSAVTDSDLLTSDVTANNVSITKHGFAPKLPNDATKYLDGTGAYSTPAGSGTSPVFAWAEGDHSGDISIPADSATHLFGAIATIAAATGDRIKVSGNWTETGTTANQNQFVGVKSLNSGTIFAVALYDSTSSSAGRVQHSLLGELTLAAGDISGGNARFQLVAEVGTATTIRNAAGTLDKTVPRLAVENWH